MTTWFRMAMREALVGQRTRFMRKSLAGQRKDALGAGAGTAIYATSHPPHEEQQK
jgi:hypothetical protein